MDWKDIAGVVGKAAPIIGTILGGPLGGAVGGLVSSALGVDNTPDAVSAAITADPTALEKLKEAELNSKVQLQQLMITQEANQQQYQLGVYQAEAGDRDSARKLAAATPKDWLRPSVAVLIIVATVAVVFLVLLGFADKTLQDPVIAATAGALVMYFLKESDKVTSFLFGTTKNAEDTNTNVRQFAVSPGVVSSDPSAVAGTTVVNNSQ